MANQVGSIQKFLKGKNSPLAPFARSFVQAGAKYGIDPRFLVAISGAESSFGQDRATQGIFNPFGWGPHIKFNSYPDAIDAIAKGLSTGPYYKTKGKTTIPSIGATWAPIGASNDPTNLNSNWTRNVTEYYRQLGGDPRANVFSNSPSLPRNMSANDPNGIPLPVTGGTPPPAIAASGVSWPELVKIFEANRLDIMQGRTPSPKRLEKLLSVLAKGQAGQAVQLAQQQAGNVVQQQQQAQAKTGVSGKYDPRELYGFKKGGVDSGLAAPGGAGGDWGGSMPRALELAHAVGANPSSQKRSRRLTASGGVSDHWQGSTSSYAVDLPTSGAAGDALFAKIQKFLGPKFKIKSGQWNNVNVGGYRYQIGWRVKGHYDHIHVGVKKN